MQKLFFLKFIYSLLPDALFYAVLEQKIELVILKQQFGGFSENLATINQHPLDDE